VVVHVTDVAADSGLFELLNWLVRCGCPWEYDNTLGNLEISDGLDHWKQLRAVSGPWPAADLTRFLSSASSYSEFEMAAWLREQGAPWPISFCDTTDVQHSACWSLECVQWAIASGSTWLDWSCQDLATAHYDCQSDSTEHSDDTCHRKYCGKQHAAELFQWAHENGCPCTCDEAAVAA
jgi:hypothetical protein